MALAPNERAAQIMEHLVKHASHGYSQISREGAGGYETIKLSDGTRVTLALGDRDCSSAVCDAYRRAGVNIGNASYTGNMRANFVGSGNFVWHPGTSYSAKRGDVYLNESYHTAMCVHPYGSREGDILAEFSGSEYGTIDGAEGDQTGWESHECSYYDYPWTGILEYVGKGSVTGAQSDKDSAEHEGDTAPTSGSLNRVTVKYALRVKNGAWLKEVTNFGAGENGFAGYPFKQHDMFYAKVSKGSIKYRLHTVGGGWSAWKKDGEKCGTAGKTVDGVQIYYTTKKGEPYRQAWYRSQTTEREGYLDVVCDDGTTYTDYPDRYAGIYGEPLDRLQICVCSRNPF